MKYSSGYVATYVCMGTYLIAEEVDTKHEIQVLHTSHNDMIKEAAKISKGLSTQIWIKILRIQQILIQFKSNTSIWNTHCI